MLTFIVAEIGVNWNGDAILLENMIENAKKAGCNAVKFQSFDEKIVKDHPQSSHLLKSSVSKSNIELINSIAKKNNIEWFSTPMYSEAVEILDPYVEKFKIRFTDGENLLKNKTSDLFKKILETGKKVFVSTEINPKNCKCIDCMKLYCKDHLHNHRKDCVKSCKFCRTKVKIEGLRAIHEDSAEVLIANLDEEIKSKYDDVNYSDLQKAHSLMINRITRIKEEIKVYSELIQKVNDKMEELS